MMEDSGSVWWHRVPVILSQVEEFGQLEPEKYYIGNFTRVWCSNHNQFIEEMATMLQGTVGFCQN